MYVHIGVNNASYKAFQLLRSASWRRNAYSFCSFGCLGVVLVNSYDAYNTAVNGDFHQVVNGSCQNSFTISDDAWSRAQANPPTALTTGYYKCSYTVLDIFVTAVGTAEGTASILIPIAFIAILVLASISPFSKKRLFNSIYTQEERDKVTCYVATHLLLQRDAEITYHESETSYLDSQRDFSDPIPLSKMNHESFSLNEMKCSSKNELKRGEYCDKRQSLYQELIAGEDLLNYYLRTDQPKVRSVPITNSRIPKSQSSEIMQPLKE
jgi:hypothetical protein